jgi:hypothetical protein
VTLDMPASLDVPEGHGPRYTRESVEAGATLLRPSGWSEDDAAPPAERRLAGLSLLMAEARGSPAGGGDAGATRLDPGGMTGGQGRQERVSAVGLPEVIGFAIGAGAMAKALVVLEANLSGSDLVRRLVRKGGLVAELERVALGHGMARPVQVFPIRPLVHHTGLTESEPPTP